LVRPIRRDELQLVLFAIDSVFYGAIGYGLVAAYKRFIAQPKPVSNPHSYREKTL
jgi:hypothetical protein